MPKVFQRILYIQIDTFMTTKFSPYLCGFRRSHKAQYFVLKMIDSCKKAEHWIKEKNRGNADGHLKGF